MKKNLFKFIICLYPLFLLGCTSLNASLPDFTYHLSNGEYKQAQRLTTEQAKKNKGPNALLWNLEAGSVERDMKEYRSSNKYFDRAEESFKSFDLKLSAERSLQTGKGIILNDSFMPYKGKIYDRIMVNTYKALNYASMGDFANARIEFNRALQRQDNAKTLFRSQTAKLKEQIYTENSNSQSPENVIDDTLNNPGLDNIIKNRYKNLDNFSIFSDFINPFSTYIAGLFFWLEGDASKAVDILKEAYAMNPSNKFVSEDLARLIRGDSPRDEIWVVFENGLCPYVEEMRVDIPVFLYSDHMLYIGTAFPNLVMKGNTSPFLSVSSNSSSTVRTDVISSMDNVIASEFKKEIPNIILKEVSRVALKTFLQYKMEKEYGPLAGIAAGLYQAFTTAADTRIWSALPKDFQIAHLNIPDDRVVKIGLKGYNSFTINIPSDCKNVILYVRSVSAEARPAFHFIKFE